MNHSDRERGSSPTARAEAPKELAAPKGFKKALSILGFPLLIASILVAVFVFKDNLLYVLENQEAFRAWILEQGSTAVLVFIGAQIVQVVAFVLPGEITQLAGGYLFGIWAGTLWSVLGIALGSAVNYLLGRVLGRPFLVSVFKREWVEKIESMTSKGKAEAGMFLLFALPGFPKDLLTYLAGMTKMNFWTFLAISMVGRFPALFISSMIGHSTQQTDYAFAIGALLVAGLIFALGLFYREKLFGWIDAALHRNRRDASGDR
jgi:uncharacterized membrane protein YdjX (TVP38/TMEM64 family)